MSCRYGGGGNGGFPEAERGSFGKAQGGVGENDETTLATPRKQSATPHPTMSAGLQGTWPETEDPPEGKLSVMDENSVN